MTEEGEQEEEALEEKKEEALEEERERNKKPEWCTGDKPASFPLNNRNHKRRAINRNALLIDSAKQINYP